MAKREPLLADGLLLSQADGSWGRNLKKPLLDYSVQRNTKLQVAKRFVLDDEAIAYAANFAMNHPDIVAQCLDFAIPPHPVMWVEFSGIPYTNIMDPHYGYTEGKSDKRAGFLVANGEFTWATHGYSALTPYTWHPISWSSTPLTLNLADLFDKTGLDRSTLGFFYWGHAIHKVADTALESELYARYSFDRFVMEMIHKSDRVADASEILKAFVAGSRGDMLLAATILLVLNRESNNTVVREVKPQSAMMKNKVRTLVSHSVISFNLTPDPHTYVQTGHSGVWRKEHDVRGHFCTNKRAKTSFCNGAHEWQETRPHIWQCERCKGLKWWRKEHKRGNADKGIVTQEYNVTAERKHHV